MITNTELFYIINHAIRVVNGEKLFKLLDYGVAYNPQEPVGISSTDFDVIAETRFGRSEGIYTDIYAVDIYAVGKERIQIGVYKTLSESKDSFRNMAQIGAEFSIASYDFLNSYYNDVEKEYRLSKSEIDKLCSDFADSYTGI